MKKTESNNQQEPNFQDMTIEQQLAWAQQKCEAFIASKATERNDLLHCTNRDFNTGFWMGWEHRQKLIDGIGEIYDKILNK